MKAARNRALLKWYAAAQRPLPWRKTDDPWAILVSEVMSQQTQVVRVVDRFDRFMAEYPTPGAFAKASDHEVLSIWSGLGYNSRAMRLRAAALRISETGWPTTLEGLQNLPGVGPYTAAAVASFAFGAPVPAVDTNVRRVVSRWLGEALNGRPLHDAARALQPEAEAALWNQAMMDLGATVCRPNPDCVRCPVADWCADPEVYVPPTPQGRWDGSARQARGAVVRALLNQSLTMAELSSATGLEADRCARAVNDLVDETLVTVDGEHFVIAGSGGNG